MIYKKKKCESIDFGLQNYFRTSYISVSVHWTQPDPVVEKTDEDKANDGDGIHDRDDSILLDEDAPEDANSEDKMTHHKHHFGYHLQVTSYCY